MVIFAGLAMMLGAVVSCGPMRMVSSGSEQETVSADQFETISKNGVAIACPKSWRSIDEPESIYCVRHNDYIRISVVVVEALPLDYYETLAAEGTVKKSTVNGNPLYRNDYTYAYQNHLLTTECITVVNGNRACHIMILCETDAITVFQPTFTYVLNSLNFLTGCDTKTNTLKEEI